MKPKIAARCVRRKTRCPRLAGVVCITAIGLVSSSFAQELVQIRIEGSSEVPEGGTRRYSVVALFSDEREFDVTLFSGLSVDPGVSGRIGRFGDFAAFAVDGDTTETIRAEFEFEGQMRSASRSVTILNVPIAGFALSFDGVDDAVRVPRSPTLELSDELTIEAWVLASSEGSRNSRLVRNAGPNGPGYLLAWRQDYDSRLQLRLHNVSDVGFGTGVCADTSYTDEYVGTWHHVAGTYSAPMDKLRLYVDGTQKCESTGIGPLTYSDQDVYIGNFNLNSEEEFDGQVDEVRIWNRARTECEIRGNMHRRLTGTEPGLVGYWRFDDGDGQVVTDSSPFHNDGVLGNDVGAQGDTADPKWELSTSGVILPPGAQPEAGDLDCNGTAGLTDFSDFLDCVLGPKLGLLVGCERADLDVNGHVDLLDFSNLQRAFTGGE